MIRAAFLITLGLAISLSGFAGARAEERRLTGPEISSALTGNTVDGVWGSTVYRSYFDANGVTINQRKGVAPDHGKWRIDQDRYCSWWAKSGWSCYDLYQDGDTIIWGIPESEKRYPSTLLKGRQLY